MDTTLVSKIETYKSGHFALSRHYDRSALKDDLIRAEERYRMVAETPILPNYAARLDEEVIIKSIFGTAALEGNPLDEEEVKQVLDRGGQEMSPDRARREIANLKEAYQRLRKPPEEPGSLLLSENLIKDIHHLITQGIEHPRNRPGRYREERVQVGDADHGGVYTPPKILADIKKLMTALVEWINSEELLQEPPIVRAALAHYHLALIHPFSDGNGRTARLLEAFMLHAHNIRYVPPMLSNYYYRHLDEYYLAFSRARRDKDHDMTPFVGFVLQGFLEALERTRQRMNSFIRTPLLRHHYNFLFKTKYITQRQHDLLNLLLDDLPAFTLDDLFTQPRFVPLYRRVSERTARRDLERLSNLGLLWRDEKRRWNLSLLALDEQQ